jgi:hypothetical protein
MADDTWLETMASGDLGNHSNTYLRIKHILSKIHSLDSDGKQTESNKNATASGWWDSGHSRNLSVCNRPSVSIARVTIMVVSRDDHDRIVNLLQILYQYVS